ncbi:MAG: MFS transporter [Anaerolineae bacterium]|nr:MFS transporter [Anaerolineae bacterium]
MRSKIIELEPDPRRWLVLAAAITAVLSTVMDGAVISLIAPEVAANLNADATTIGLISSINVLMIAAFVLGGGALGDVYGRKRFLSYGLIGLSITSTLAFLTPNALWLIVVRALAGIMVAVINPLALAIITVTFDDRERPRALGLYGAALGIAGVLSLIVISFLNQRFGWRTTFGPGGLLAVTALLMIIPLVPESKASGDKQVDWAGILLAAAGLFGLIYGINKAATQGFASSVVLAPVGVGLVLLVVLVLYSSKKKDPALQLVLFQKRVFSVGVLLFAVLGFASMGTYSRLSVYLQALQGISPLWAALTLLPYSLSVFVFAILVGGWVGKIGNRLLITGGLVMMGLGLAAMGFVLNPGAGFWAYLLPLVFIGGGYSICNTPRISVVLGSAPPELAGSASATNNASFKLGVALGIATLGALFQGFANKTYFADLAAMGLSTTQITQAAQMLREWLKANAGNVAAELGMTIRQLVIEISHYQHAFTVGVSQVLWVAAAVVTVGAVLAWFTFGDNMEAGRRE